MKAFLISLLSGDEKVVNSVITLGVFAFGFLCTMSLVAFCQDHTTWNPTSFMAASTGIIGTVAGGKTVHDRWANPQERQQ